MQPSHRRRHPMDWTPSVTLAARPRTHAPRTHTPDPPESVYRGLPSSLPVPPPSKTNTPPVTPAPMCPASAARDLLVSSRNVFISNRNVVISDHNIFISNRNVVVSDHDAPSYHDDIFPFPDSAPPDVIKCRHFFGHPTQHSNPPGRECPPPAAGPTPPARPPAPYP